MTVSDGVSPSPRGGGGGAGWPPPLNPQLNQCASYFTKTQSGNLCPSVVVLGLDREEA